MIGAILGQWLAQRHGYSREIGFLGGILLGIFIITVWSVTIGLP